MEESWKKRRKNERKEKNNTCALTCCCSWWHVGLLPRIGRVSLWAAALWTIDLENCAQRQRNPLCQQQQQHQFLRVQEYSIVMWFPRPLPPLLFFFFMIIILLFLLLFVAHLVGRTCVPGHGGTDFFTWAKKGGTTTKNKRERKRTWNKVGWISWTNPEDLFHSSSFLSFFFACLYNSLCVCVLQNDLVGHVLLDTTHKSQSAS